MPVDEARIGRFLDANPLRRQVAGVLRAAGFQVVWVTEDAEGARWGFFIKLPERLRRLFGTAREVLVWVAQYREFQARTVMQAGEIIAEQRPRLSEDFAIVLTFDRATAERVAETGETLNTHYIGFQIDDFIREFAPKGGASFLEALQQRLYSRDLYDLPTAVTRSDDFFGRRSLVTDFSTRLKQGGRHIGLFGLRKIGKTSFLYRLRSNLSNNEAAYVAHLDIERLDAIRPDANYFLWSLGEAVLDSHRTVRALPGFRLFGKYATFLDIPDRSAVVDLFDHDFRLLLTLVRRPLVIMLDEIELMSPDTPGSQWGETFVRVWRLLRGIDQQFPGKISYLVAGTNPQPLESNQLGGRENPVYNFFSIEYMKPLAADEGAHLLATIGSRMGLVWQPEALERTVVVSGGHPALLRALGSLVHRHRTTLVGTSIVPGSLVPSLVSRFLVERNSLISQIVAVIEDQYPNEYYLLQTLAAGQVSEFRELAAGFPEDVAHLVGYGLCTDPSSCTGLTVELLQTYLQRRLAAGSDGAQPSQVRMERGATVGDYVIEATIGRPGGFARVYEARRADNQSSLVALKVFEFGSLTALQRELEPLLELDHPNIVHVVDYGKTTQGVVYMAMERLEGGTLHQFCNRANRMSEDLAVDVLGGLLSALVAMHPNAERIGSLRREQTLGAADLEGLLIARHGFVHRDIKPENVVLTDRGPVLIDFNISVRASTPRRTVSATPGYLPLDEDAETWTPDVDLYQLGLTLMQTVVGVDLSQSSVDSLRQVCREQVGPALGHVLLKLAGATLGERYRSAVQALSDVHRLRERVQH